MASRPGVVLDAGGATATKIGDFYEDQVAASVKALTSILAPVMRRHVERQGRWQLRERVARATATTR